MNQSLEREIIEYAREQLSIISPNVVLNRIIDSYGEEVEESELELIINNILAERENN